MSTTAMDRSEEPLSYLRRYNSCKYPDNMDFKALNRTLRVYLPLRVHNCAYTYQ
jgi:hypothetical protein